MKLVKLLMLLSLAGCATPEVEKPKAVEPVEAKVQCAGTIMVGWASEAEVTPQDRNNYEIAKNRCPQLYVNSPCLVKFEKVGEGNYHATCGEPK